ncbi:HNH endonuclease, partial [Bacillus cereus]|uniref:HNH endonuclease n=2 Tax=Bacillus TaxID=1386 RepID=UPI003012A33B
IALQFHGGYYRVELNHKGKRLRFYSHRLVAKTFINNIDNKPEVNHIDGDKLNNHVSNLEWCTGEENMRHAIDNGLRKGVKTKDVIEIYKDCWINQMPTHKVMKKYNVSKHCVHSIKYKKSYKSILSKVKVTINIVV